MTCTKLLINIYFITCVGLVYAFIQAEILLAVSILAKSKGDPYSRDRIRVISRFKLKKIRDIIALVNCI